MIEGQKSFLTARYMSVLLIERDTNSLLIIKNEKLTLYHNEETNYTIFIHSRSTIDLIIFR